MKKTMRRMTALLMVLSLCTGILVLPVAAEENPARNPEEPNATVTVEIRDRSGDVIGEKTITTTTTPSGTTTTEQTTTTDPSGATTTTEQTTSTTTTPSGTVVGESTTESTTQVTTSETETDGMLTETEKQWSSEEIWYDPDVEKEIDENTSQTIEGNTQTTVEGSSGQEDHVQPDGKETHYSGSETGTETTVITDTTTITTTTENDLLDSQTENPDVVPEFEEGKYDDPAVQDQSEWVRDPDNDVTDTTWETIPGTETENTTTQTQEVIPDPLAGSTDVTLQMTPGGTDTEKAKLPGADALRAVIPQEGTQSDGSVVTYNYENGILVGYTVTRYSSEATQIDDDIVEGETSEMELVSRTEDVYVLPQGYTVGTETSSIQSRDGNTTVDTQVVTTQLEDGSGYRIVTTEVVTTGTDSIQDPLDDITGSSPDDFYSTPIIPRNAVWVSEEGDTYIQLPGKPENSTTTDDEGNTTTVTVEEIKDSVTGVVIGYKSTTTVTDSDGRLKSRSSTTEYGSITTFSTVVERDPDTKQVTTVTEQIVKGLQDTQTFTSTTSGTRDINTTRVGQEDIYQIVETQDGLVFLYEGKMYQIVDNSYNTSSQSVMNDGRVDVNSFINGSGEAAANDLRIDGQGYGNYYTGSDFGKSIGTSWTLSGYGLYSDLQVKETDGETHTTRHFELQRNNNGTIETIYVYCVEMGTNIAYGSNYGAREYKDSGDSNVPWKGATGTIGQLRSVALNGYWGTENGLGSLEAVKDLMRRNGVEGWEELTPGMAITATQVAIWEFGTKTSGQFGGYDENGNAYGAASGYEFIYMDGTTSGIDDDKMKIVEDLRDLLVRLAYDAEQGVAEEIDGSDITGGAITLKERVSEGEDGRDVYNTDLSFTLDVSTSSLNGDMIVTVVVDGEEVGYARLAGNETPSLLDSLINWGKIYPDENGTYTISDVELTEGVKVDLQLTGTQHLDDGVYIFESGTWQDFVGLSTLERNVDVTVSMEFNVTEPEMTLEHTQKQWNELKTHKEAYVRTNTLGNSRIGVQTDTTVTVTTDLYGTRTQTDVITTVKKAQRDWESYYSYTLTEEVANDKEVDPADPPKTGDTTLILALVSLFSAGGMVMLNRKKEEE